LGLDKAWVSTKLTRSVILRAQSTSLPLGLDMDLCDRSTSLPLGLDMDLCDRSTSLPLGLDIDSRGRSRQTFRSASTSRPRHGLTRSVSTSLPLGLDKSVSIGPYAIGIDKSSPINLDNDPMLPGVIGK
ncbi:hypothetical protein VIGAN_UM034700, partial [Vigna angularis var. angularis]